MRAPLVFLALALARAAKAPPARVGGACASVARPIVAAAPSAARAGARARARAGAALALALACVARAPPPSDAALAPPNALVAEAWRVVDRGYVERTFNGVDWFALRQARVGAKYGSAEDAYPAIRSMLAPLDDRFTRFLTPAQYASIDSAARGGVVGVGIELAPLPEPAGGVRVTRVIEAGPAERAGVRAGDVIVRVDQQELPPALTADEIAAQIRGPPGSRVVLTVRHAPANDAAAASGDTAGTDAGASVANLEMAREAVKLTSVRAFGARLSAASERPALVLEIRSFSSETPSQVEAALRSADARGARAIVVDLRGNGGGSLQGGIDAARLFLPDGATIVSVADRTGVPRVFAAENGGAIELNIPVTLLVNRDTASAAEVFAAALAENGRATIVGERTYGKGIIQTLVKLEQGGGGGVAFTTARYRTPRGNDINRAGLPAALAAADGGGGGGAGAERGEQSACLRSGGVGRAAAECVPAAALVQ
ncbi:hypothetical protein KFE25_011685 [Diacronema lutheri]|uniref:PDZ domain-containing protein n=2 Tax=Diacronema lutheri TaxID=2081491 RepID=A0A8J6C259_DIALT|nr:hypothetical protein KFE25_011661 [Diacronema lutheri]KAG8458154.1 hypothetical protein KFE25_011685 [Diacronema lutheri]